MGKQRWYDTGVVPERNRYGRTLAEWLAYGGKMRAAYWRKQGFANLRIGSMVHWYWNRRHANAAELTGWLQEIGAAEDQERKL